jgi:bacterioferritin-associated ferredoxin/ferredoxin
MEGPKSSALAVVDNSKCVACFRCVDICNDDALLAPRREESIEFGTDPESVDQRALEALCTKAHMDPEAVACICSSTTVKEIAAAILNGAKSLEETALATGAQSGCLMYCFAPIHRLLVEHLGPDLKPTIKNKWYPTSQNLFDVPEEVAARYPLFAIREEQQALTAIFNERLSQTGDAS